MDREEPGGPHTVHGGHEEPDMTNYAHTHAHTHSHDHKLYLAYKEKQSGWTNSDHIFYIISAEDKSS